LAEPAWPEKEERRLIGQRLSRLDGPQKVTGAAKYTADVSRPGMLVGKLLHCPHAHARVKRIDVSAAEKVPGVKAVRVIQGEGSEIQWALDEVAAVAGATEEAAEDGIRAIRVEYEVLPHFVDDEAVDRAPSVEPTEARVEGDPDAAFAAAAVKVEGFYGLPSVAHCCLEPHGQVTQWDDAEHLTAWCSTQGVSTIGGEYAEGLEIAARDVTVLAPHVGGGFGSKFGADRWGIECAKLSKAAGAPVKLMLDRAAELAVAGDRPSCYARVKVGASSDGTLVSWSSESWGSGGLGGSGSPPLPYVFQVPARRQRHRSVVTNTASARAWRAPNHPQACFITLSAIEDVAAALRMDPVELLRRNLALTGALQATYEEELRLACELIDWKAKWHPRGASGPGPIRRGLGVSLHRWGGRAGNSTCEVSVHRDGTVEAKLGSQDIGTGTRTVVGIVLAETFGLPLSGVRVQLGDSRFPPSGPSGGSTTVGGVSSATRRAALEALALLFEKVAPDLGATAADLEAASGRIRVKDRPAAAVSFADAAARIGPQPLVAVGKNPGAGKLTDAGVGGVQVAEVSVDVETGVVRVEKLVAVQDCGMVVDLKTAESQVHGGLVMGITYALCEEKVHDPTTGRLLDADMETYRLAGLVDCGELVVRLLTHSPHDERGVIGLGEPPVISPGAALSNAVANAIGVRVPYLPLTPMRVLDALASARRA
jgi:xanthine dehydrogenase YagR molybdenum-binding subunit